MFNKDLFLKKGYSHFNLKDFNEELFNELDLVYNSLDFPLENYIQSLLISSQLKKPSIDFFNDIETRFKDYFELNPAYIEDKQSSSDYSISTTLNFKKDTSFSTMLEIKNYIFNKYIKNQNQSFFKGYAFKLNFIYTKIVKNILNHFYPNLNILHRGHDFTLFTKGQKIIEHNDGQNEGRVCVIILYLNKDYKKGFGGELIIDETEICEPTFGKISILDFTKNNIEHEVIAIKDDFKRFAMLNFLNSNDNDE